MMPTVIQLRGTSGSGKSTAMKSVMTRLGEWNGVYIPGRKKPRYYRLAEEKGPSVCVLGHYESPCGGADTIGSAAQIYREIDALAKMSIETILVEGLLLSEDVKWTTQLKEEGSKVLCFFLTTPLDQCLSQIEGRRKAVGNEKPVNPKNTANRVGTIERARTKLTTAGVRCIRCSANQAPALIQRLLRLHAE